jgi:molybdopterin synthase catalytic subunit
MIQITKEVIDRLAVVDLVTGPESGSVVTFDGRVRDHARGKMVTGLFYEVYEEMAKNELEEIQRQALKRWPISRIGIVHRVGRLEIGETSVFIAVSSAHRREGFEACRFIIDNIKTRVPIWKKEFYEDGEVWVEHFEQESG